MACVEGVFTEFCKGGGGRKVRSRMDIHRSVRKFSLRKLTVAHKSKGCAELFTDAGWVCLIREGSFGRTGVYVHYFGVRSGLPRLNGIFGNKRREILK